MFSTQSIVYAWDNGLRYALALLGDLSDEQMMLRPGGNMNHPAWILGHMSLNQDSRASASRKIGGL